MNDEIIITISQSERNKIDIYLECGMCDGNLPTSLYFVL